MKWKFWLVLGLVAVALFIGLNGRKSEPPTQQQAPTPTCADGDLGVILAEGVEDPGACLNAILAKTGGEGKWVRVSFMLQEGKWIQASPAIPDPSAKAYATKVHSDAASDSANLVVEHDEKTVYRNTFQHGTFAILEVVLADLEGPDVVSIQEGGSQTAFEVA